MGVVDNLQIKFSAMWFKQEVPRRSVMVEFINEK